MWATPTLEYAANIFVQPDTVNFYSIQLFEGYADAVVSGRYTNTCPVPPHSANPPMGMAGYITGKGSKMFQYDSIYGSGCQPPYPMETSTAIWPIVWSYGIDGEATKEIELVNQTFTLIGQGGNVATFTIIKDESGASISTGGTAHFITP